jgi:hypothetical protein
MTEARGTAILRVTPAGYRLDTKGACVPPGYTFDLAAPMPWNARDGMELEYVVRPSPGWRARYLRWRFPGVPK